MYPEEQIKEKKWIILMSGISGSGKTTYSLNLIKNNFSVVRICADELRAELSENGDESDQKSIIIDITAPDKKSRKQVIKWARENNVPIECHYFEPNLQLAKRQNLMRNRSIPECVIERQAAKWQTPSIEEGFFSITKIN